MKNAIKLILIAVALFFGVGAIAADFANLFADPVIHNVANASLFFWILLAAFAVYKSNTKKAIRTRKKKIKVSNSETVERATV